MTTALPSHKIIAAREEVLAWIFRGNILELHREEMATATIMNGERIGFRKGRTIWDNAICNMTVGVEIGALDRETIETLKTYLKSIGTLKIFSTNLKSFGAVRNKTCSSAIGPD
jgi:hypothetical protein